ncbi:70-Kd heat shock protein [Cucumis melo var. makuwa]|uniref:70-Kd heat shock protein n=1 Tax=Cucumis melo var. makuwa TaxID=1194695 RepID=A0A5A7T8A3_CUCMM|nr:70-Kd heat shock protein [Cucumis melo var. makuwa]
MAGKGEGPAIETDLGTTYSCVGVWQHDRVEIIANDQGNRTTPSYVAFIDSERLIGDAAKNQISMNPINTVFGGLFLFYSLMINDENENKESRRARRDRKRFENRVKEEDNGGNVDEKHAKVIEYKSKGDVGDGKVQFGGTTDEKRSLGNNQRMQESISILHKKEKALQEENRQLANKV